MIRNRLADAAACLALGVVLAAGAVAPARAENHALIMWIGQYADPRANLPGIDLDAKAARAIASAMGVPPANITELKNEQLALRSMSEAINALTARIKSGDKVFLYYSGHGGQQVSAPGGTSKCSEGLVAHDVQLYFDVQLESDLSKLGAKASQVVMLNDSCFSGGAATKAVPKGGFVAKNYPLPIAKPAAAPDYHCGQAVNLTKNLQVVPREGARLLYIAASRDDELSYAGPTGSLATQAWAACIEDPATDKDRSGSISGAELAACAQARVDRNPSQLSQHLTTLGSPDLPVATLGGSGDAGTTPVRASGVLDDLRRGRDENIAVALTPSAKELTIGKDELRFEIETAIDGYLYLFQIGSDGKTINILFPNDYDRDNRIVAGQRHAFPRPSWALKASGPPGTTRVMALISPQPKDFSGVGQKRGPFATVPATRHATKNLVVVATGATPGGQGRYGASTVATIVEKP